MSSGSGRKALECTLKWFNEKETFYLTFILFFISMLILSSLFTGRNVIQYVIDKEA